MAFISDMAASAFPDSTAGRIALKSMTVNFNFISSFAAMISISSTSMPATSPSWTKQIGGTSGDTATVRTPFVPSDGVISLMS